MSARTVASLAVALSVGLLTSAAQANLVTGTLGSANYSVNCPDGCTLLDPPGTPISDVGPANPTNEVNFLNSIAGTSFTAGNVTTVNTNNNGESINLNIFGPYFWLKIDGMNAGYLYFQNNDTIPPQTVTYSATGTATGLSHFAQVPLPAAALLFLSGLGGLFGWRRWSGQGEAAVPQMA